MSLAESLFYDFITLLAIVNPVQAAAVFSTLTLNRSPAQQKNIATRACVAALIILIVFGFGGEFLLKALGISFGAFRVAGGTLLLLVGFNMVFAKESAVGDRATDEEDAHQAEDPSIFPLAIPIIAGPGALTTIITLVSKRRESPLEVALVLVVALVVVSITLFALRISRPLLRFFGTSGVNAVGRVMGILVASISVQLIVTSLRELFPILNR